MVQTDILVIIFDKLANLLPFPLYVLVFSLIVLSIGIGLFCYKYNKEKIDNWMKLNFKTIRSVLIVVLIILFIICFILWHNTF